MLLVLPAFTWRRELKGPTGPTERVFDYSVLPCLCVAASVPPGVSVRILCEDYQAIDFEDDVDLVGLSVMTTTAPRAWEIAARFRARGVPVIAGGFHPTLHPEDALRHVHAVCVGDGEPVVRRMIEDLRAGRLAGRYEAPPGDLAALPPPDHRAAGRRSLFRFDVVEATGSRTGYGSTLTTRRRTTRPRPSSRSPSARRPGPSSR